MVLYYSLGLLREGSPEDALRQICKRCECEESRKTGKWRADITPYDVQMLLFNAGHGPLITKKGSNGKEIVARIPLEITDEKVMEVYRHLSQVQAIQRMKTCYACQGFSLSVLEEKHLIDEPVVII